MVDESIREANMRAYERECRLSFGIEKRYRHNSLDGRWYGPGPEAYPPGPLCPCVGCCARFRNGKED